MEVALNMKGKKKNGKKGQEDKTAATDGKFTRDNSVENPYINFGQPVHL